MKPRPDLLDSRCPAGLEVYQLTEGDLPACHVYMEAQIFTPDSRRLVLHESAHAHGSEPADPRHRYLLCDLEDGGRLSPLTHETGVTAPCISPDGHWFYYFVDETRLNGGALTLRRVRLDGRERQTLVVLDAPIPGTRYRPSRIYPICTISADGRRIALPAFLGDGVMTPPPWGLLVFDLEDMSVRVPLAGPEWGNLHPQYCRDPNAAHDVMVQHDHGNAYAPDGALLARQAAAHDSADRSLCRAARQAELDAAASFTGLGLDIHVIRDDGGDWQGFPWGRDDNEKLQGHQCWRGQSTWAICSTLEEGGQARLIESQPVHTDALHVGARISGGVRNDLGRELPRSAFYHFATDRAGSKLIADYGPFLAATEIHLADLGEPGRDAARWRFLLDTRGPVSKQTQVHPFLSPDGRLAFFNSAESGTLQAYMIVLDRGQ